MGTSGAFFFVALSSHSLRMFGSRYLRALSQELSGTKNVVSIVVHRRISECAARLDFRCLN
jgi:hypothetical protein